MPSSAEPLTIVVPTRNHPEHCRRLLESLRSQIEDAPAPLQVVFLANDTNAEDTAALEEIACNSCYVSLRSVVRVAAQNYATAEENIRFTLGGHLDDVGEIFLIVGNTDHVRVEALRRAASFLKENRLELLLLGVANRETHQGKTLRQLYSAPRHLHPKNRLPAFECVGPRVFADAATDYGVTDYLAFIGCQLYTKAFFRALCAVEAGLPDPLYSHSIGTLELTQRETYALGFSPEVVAIRVDELEAPADSPGRYKSATGRSSHILLSVLSNSLALSASAFALLVNSQSVAICRGLAQYDFSNFLFKLIYQMSRHVMQSGQDVRLRYCRDELGDIAAFGKRLATVDIGLPAEASGMLCNWLQCFPVIGDYADAKTINTLLAGAAPVLALLEARPGMDRWMVEAV